MKIKKLAVKGFMRFKEQQEIIFPENQVTLIFGENGAGKTSLLDAICIGLYGRTFRTSFDPEAGFLTVQDLVNHESTKASIHVEFENYGHSFVVNREISRSSATAELLEDGEVKVQDDDVSDYVTSKALGLDWDGFTKSTVILQGEMNALTDALPATRREAFVKLFGLDKYSRYKQIAKVGIEQKNLRVKELEAANKVLTNEVAKIPQVTSSIKRLRKTIENLEKQKTSSGKKVKRVTKLKTNLETDYRKYIKVNERIDNLNTRIMNVEKMMQRKKNDLKHFNALQNNFASIKKSYGELFSITKTLKSMKRMKSRYDRLESQITSLKGSLNNKKEPLLEIQKDIDISKTIMHKMKKQIPSLKAIKTVRQRKAALERKRVEFEEVRYQLDALLNVALNTVNELRKDMRQIKHKHTCPVCTQKIHSPKNALKRCMQEIKSLESNIKKKQIRLKSVSVEIGNIDQKLAIVETTKNKLDSLHSKQNELIEENKRLYMSNKKRKEIQRQIDLVRNNIEQHEKQLRSLRFDVGEYNLLEKKLTSLRQEKIVEKFFGMKTQLKQIPKLENEVSRMSSSLLKMEKERKRMLAQIKKLKDIENRFAVIKDELQSAEKIYDQNIVALAKEQTNYRAVAKQQIELKRKERKQQNNEDEIEKLLTYMSAFEELVHIFMDIPENILKRLIPYVEKEGNAIINELSEGTITTINIDSETLSIGATMGGEVRSIQYFSGGQQTRINMALRVAISRILSDIPHTDNRASAIMQTLFIDEGDFGNLDEAGVRDTMAVIYNLTREFNRIVLISHLESVRNIFQGYTADVVKTTPSQSLINTPVEAISIQLET